MKCRHCKMRLVGIEEVDGICFDCQESAEDAENLNELNRYREMFPIPPWDDSPITAEVCERLCIAWIHCTVGGCPLLDFWCEWGNHKGRVDVRYGAVQSFSSINTAGQLACLVAARRNNEKH